MSRDDKELPGEDTALTVNQGERCPEENVFGRGNDLEEKTGCQRNEKTIRI